MYAYIQDDTIAFISATLIESKLDYIEYSNINRPILQDGALIEYVDLHDKIRQDIILAESLVDFDLQWQVYTDIEIGEIITARVFGNNPHAEKALTNKILAITLSLLQGITMTKEMETKIADATTKKSEVDAVRNLFSLWNL